MRLVFTALSLLLIVSVCGGCAGLVMAPFSPPPGLMFSQVKAPLDVDFDKTTLGTKEGKAEATSILGLFSFGDCSTQTAAKDGGLTTINHADYEMMNVMGIFSKTTVIVYGD
ncbi:TRL-like family protein [Verrucomicrobiota bacterium]